MPASVPAGRINKLFGTEGGVMLSLYEAFPDDFDPAQTPLFVAIDGLEVPLWCERFERRGATGAVVSFADMDTPRRAGELLGREFRIELAQDGEDDEFYLEDLIGFAVEAETFGAEETAAAVAPSAADAAFASAGGGAATGGASQRGAAAAHVTRRGVVSDYYDSELNPLFELEIEGRRVLVPAVEEFIAHIDFEARTLRMVLPAGLTELD